ncbi:MAG TPA: hypothetical protein VM253_00055 [Candidatus Limnocylindrales bacterium]|nr:hypothetical protein [Candidatus Limnocylindrales bacterium]
MSTRRLTLALLAALMLSSLTTGSAAAKRPQPAAPAEERPLTEEELAESDLKVAAAEEYAVALADDGTDLATLSCITPQGGESTDDASVESGCTTPSGALSVEARDQTKSHYCGPAVGQVIANYTWMMASGKNKYSQSTIATWMQTDAKGYTNAPELRDGLTKATASAPRLPSNWKWVITYLTDTDSDGVVGDQLHDYVRWNVSGSKMPLAFAVKPYDRNSKYHLSSWAKPVSSVGHWIAAYGWYATWTNNDTPRIYYTDSSKDEGGSTGKFWDPTRTIAALIMEHTQRFVW